MKKTRRDFLRLRRTLWIRSEINSRLTCLSSAHSALIYGWKNWFLGAHNIRRLEVFGYCLMWQILQINWDDGVSSLDAYPQRQYCSGSAISYDGTSRRLLNILLHVALMDAVALTGSSERGTIPWKRQFLNLREEKRSGLRPASNTPPIIVKIWKWFMWLICFSPGGSRVE